MVGAAGNSVFWGFAPVSFKVGIYLDQTFGCFDEGEVYVYAIFAHGLYFLPIDATLGVGNVNTVDGVLRRDMNIEAFVGAVARVLSPVLYPLPARRKYL